MKEKTIKPNLLMQKSLKAEKFNLRIALLSMRKGSTGHIADCDKKAESVRVGIARFKKQGLGEWEASTKNVPTGIMVKRIR